MSRAVTLDRRLAVLMLAACLAAVGLVATAGAPAKADATTLYTLINQARQQAGLKPLVRDARIDAVAQSWTSRMASSGTLSHNPSYSSQIPSGWTRAGENVGYNYSDSALHTALMNSAGHRANILGAYTSVGIGWVKDSGGRIWATQVFASYPGVTAPAVKSPSVTDMTGDARTDLVGVNYAGDLVAVPGTGTGALRSTVKVGSGWGGMRDLLPVSDASRDGLSDLYARSTDGKLWFYKGVAGGGLGRGTQVGSGWGGMTALVDMDGNRDGSTDLYGRDSTGRLWFYPSNGAGAVGRGVQVGTGWNGMTAMVSPGDVTRDGVSDLIARDASGRLWLYPGNGRVGGFLRSKVIGTGWGGMTAVVAPGDLNGDRVGDLVGRASNGAFWFYAGTGTGTFRSGVNLGTSWSGLTKLG